MLSVKSFLIGLAVRWNEAKAKVIEPKLDTENWPNLRPTRCYDCGKRVFAYVGQTSGELIFLDPATGDGQTHMFRHVGKRCHPNRGLVASGRVRILNALGKTG